MSEWYKQAADSDFGKARIGELISRIASFLTLSEDNLLSLDEAKNILKPSGESYAGMRTVPIDLIVGSEGRYRDFNSRFLPRKEHLKARWTSVDVANYRDINLPPVQLYALGGVYFVRDGNHRVSVARMKGQMEIDAEVTLLESDVEIRPGMSMDELKQAVVEFEKKAFYERSGFLRVTGDPNLSFTEPGRYQTIEEHVRVHKYYINQDLTEEISFDEALWSWHENVYLPVILAIRDEGLLKHFPGRSETDLYIYLVGHWDRLKEKYGENFSLGEAAKRLSENRPEKL